MINKLAREPFSRTLLTGVMLGAVLGVIFGWGEDLPGFALTFLIWCAGGAIVYALLGVTLGRSRRARLRTNEDPRSHRPD